MELNRECVIFWLCLCSLYIQPTLGGWREIADLPANGINVDCVALFTRCMFVYLCALSIVLFASLDWLDYIIFRETCNQKSYVASK